MNNNNDNNRFKLKDEQLLEILRIDDIETIRALYKICEDQYEEENKRTLLLEDKSKSLLSSVGVILGIVFSVGGLTIEKIKNIPLPVIGCPRPYLAGVYLVLGIFLIMSGIFSYKSMMVRKDWKTKNEDDIFRGDVLEQGEGPYLRYVTAHIWKIYKNNFIINEKKACWLGLGQKLFLMSLFALAIMVIIIGIYAYSI